MTSLNDIVTAFEKFDIQSGDPKWSSWVLERFFETTLSQPLMSMTDIFQAFNLALKMHHVKLTQTVENLVMDLVKTGFSRHRAAYDDAQWDWATAELAQSASPAQCYFFALTLPQAELTPPVITAILQGLEETPQFDQAVSNLSDELEQPTVKQALQHWQAHGMRAATAVKLQSYL